MNLIEAYKAAKVGEKITRTEVGGTITKTSKMMDCVVFDGGGKIWWSNAMADDWYVIGQPTMTETEGNADRLMICPKTGECKLIKTFPKCPHRREHHFDEWSCDSANERGCPKCIPYNTKEEPSILSTLQSMREFGKSKDSNKEAKPVKYEIIKPCRGIDVIKAGACEEEAGRYIEELGIREDVTAEDLMEVLPNHLAWAPWLIDHGFIREVKEKVKRKMVLERVDWRKTEEWVVPRGATMKDWNDLDGKVNTKLTVEWEE